MHLSPLHCGIQSLIQHCTQHTYCRNNRSGQWCEILPNVSHLSFARQMSSLRNKHTSHNSVHAKTKLKQKHTVEVRGHEVKGQVQVTWWWAAPCRDDPGDCRPKRCDSAATRRSYEVSQWRRSLYPALPEKNTHFIIQIQWL